MRGRQLDDLKLVAPGSHQPLHTPPKDACFHMLPIFYPSGHYNALRAMGARGNDSVCSAMCTTKRNHQTDREILNTWKAVLEGSSRATWAQCWPAGGGLGGVHAYIWNYGDGLFKYGACSCPPVRVLQLFESQHASEPRLLIIQSH